MRIGAADKNVTEFGPWGGARLDDLTKLYKTIDAINRKVGLTVAWLALGMVLVQFTVVISRYVFSVGSIPAQETIWYMHGALFMIGAGYTLLRDGHVRVDLFYREASDKRKAAIDLLGVIFFLLPICTLIIWMSWGYVINAWTVLEGSTETNGIPTIFALKTVVPVATLFLALQGVALGARCLIVLGGGKMPPTEAPDETAEVRATPRSSRNMVVSVGVFLLAIEFLTFLIGLAHTGLTIAIARPVVLAGLLTLAYLGANWGRVAAVIGLFVAAGLSIHYGALASGDPGAIMTLLAYGNIVSALVLAVMPWAADGTSHKDNGPAASPGFAVVWGIVLYVMATEALWFIDTLLATVGTVSFADLPRWAVPAVIRIVLVAGILLLPFYRGSAVARRALAGYLALSVLWAVGQLLLGRPEGFITLVGTSGEIGTIVVAVLHAGMAWFVLNSMAVGAFQAAQRGGQATITQLEAEG
jgi:TRAP-type mannitol/chloroaromatic compound transport system permease small subunit